MSRGFFGGAAAMAGVLVVSNFLVQFPLGDFLTWAAFSYPLTFLITDCVNRLGGAPTAKKVVYGGFVFGVPLSFLFNWLFPVVEEDIAITALRIAAASGIAFFVAQWCDVLIFNRFRNARFWWAAPLASSLPGSAMDTVLFFSIAFAGTAAPWITLAGGDFAVKVLMVFLLLPSYRVVTRFLIRV